MTVIYTVATVLTVYGIETFSTLFTFNSLYSLQQCLPFTVLKLNFCSNFFFCYLSVATVLTVYGIETLVYEIYWRCKYVATVLTVYNIETLDRGLNYEKPLSVATVLTVYGIETVIASNGENRFFCRVATVLTVYGIETLEPLIVKMRKLVSCNSAYRLRYWNFSSAIGM